MSEVCWRSRIFKEQLLWGRAAADGFAGGERVEVIVDVTCDRLEVIRGAAEIVASVVSLLVTLSTTFEVGC